MGEPAHRNAAGPDDPAAGRHGPDVRRALVTEARACRLAVEELARRPGDPAALEMAGRTLAVLEYLGAEAFRAEVDDALIEAERARAIEEDRAARPARRRRPRGRLRAL